MKIKTKEFQVACKVILSAIDEKGESMFAKTLELVADGDTLHLNVTNRTYFVSVAFKLGYEDKFRAAVTAPAFLKLISKFSTEYIYLDTVGNNLKVSGNGDYTIPMNFDTNGLLELPKIEVKDNISVEQTILGSKLRSVALYNTEELKRGSSKNPAGEFYYLDEKGAITFTTGACVNSFELEKPVQMLLPGPVVQLFKLFKNEDLVEFKMGHVDVGGKLLTEVEFKTDSITVSAKLAAMSDSSLMNKFPVAPSREMASRNYDFSAVVNVSSVLSAIDRIKIFNTEDDHAFIVFSYDGIASKLTIMDYNKVNKETITLAKDYTDRVCSYEAEVDLNNFGSVLASSGSEFAVVNFGLHKYIAVKKGNIVDILPEKC